MGFYKKTQKFYFPIEIIDFEFIWFVLNGFKSHNGASASTGHHRTSRGAHVSLFFYRSFGF